MAPFELTLTLGQFGYYCVVFMIGAGFGSVLEMSGFGDSRKMAAQFYLKEMTVFKVMFTAIITAMSLIFFCSAFGWLDYDNVWVNTTYLWPGIVGGLIMGVGFVIGGFCPGTSLVSAASLKVDGIFFVLGNLLGIFVFGETIDKVFAEFWRSSHMGRFTLQDWLGADAGALALVIAVAALSMFVGAEKVEKIFGGVQGTLKNRKIFKVTAAAITLIAFAAFLKGQPSVEDKWRLLPDAQKNKLSDREVFVEPIETLHVIKGRNARPILIDLRPEAEFNLFHIVDSKNMSLFELTQSRAAAKLKKSANTVIFLISDKEETATEGWKVLAAQKVPNVYILEGGIKNWASYFSKHESGAHKKEAFADNILFRSSLGSDHSLANPDFHHYKKVKFSPKVKLANSGPKRGGCG